MGLLPGPGAQALGNREADATRGRGRRGLPAAVWFLPALPRELPARGLPAATQHPLFLDLTRASLRFCWDKTHQPLFSDAHSTAQSTPVRDCRSRAGEQRGQRGPRTRLVGGGRDEPAGAAGAADGTHRWVLALPWHPQVAKVTTRPQAQGCRVGYGLLAEASRTPGPGARGQPVLVAPGTDASSLRQTDRGSGAEAEGRGSARSPGTKPGRVAGGVQQRQTACLSRDVDTGRVLAFERSQRQS